MVCVARATLLLDALPEIGLTASAQPGRTPRLQGDRSRRFEDGRDSGLDRCRPWSPPAETGRPRKARWTHDILRLDRSFLSPSTRREQVRGPVQFLHALAFAQVGMPRMASCLSAKFGQLPPRAEHTIGSRVVAASQIGQGQQDACRSRGWRRHANGAFRARGLAPTVTCACGSSLRGSPPGHQTGWRRRWSQNPSPRFSRLHACDG